MKPDKSTGHRVGGGMQINSDNVRKEVGPLGSHEFLYMVEGRSTESRPHTDNVVGGRSCVRVCSLLCSVANRACLPPGSQPCGCFNASFSHQEHKL